jgi:hypothetical protein
MLIAGKNENVEIHSQQLSCSDDMTTLKFIIVTKIKTDEAETDPLHLKWNGEEQVSSF